MASDFTRRRFRLPPAEAPREDFPLSVRIWSGIPCRLSASASPLAHRPGGGPQHNLGDHSPAGHRHPPCQPLPLHQGHHLTITALRRHKRPGVQPQHHAAPAGDLRASHAAPSWWRASATSIEGITMSDGGYPGRTRTEPFCTLAHARLWIRCSAQIGHSVVPGEQVRILKPAGLGVGACTAGPG
jgi:hypothetical protein